jgi:Na+-driven multidrug efflux pump
VAVAIGLIFTSVALMAERWVGLFTTDPAVRALGVLYLHCQAVVFPFTGAALACYFATVGLGTVVGPFLLAVLRLVVAVVGGWLALTIGGGPLGLFAASAVAFVAFAIGLLAITRRRFDALTRRYRLPADSRKG